MTQVSKILDKRIQFSASNVLFFAIHLGVLLVFVVKVDWLGIWMALGLFAIRGLSITAGFHRFFAHHSFKTNRFTQFCLAFIGGTCGQKGVLWWVAHHREHHLHSDTYRDPHTPKWEGFYWAHLGWAISEEYHEAYNPNMVKDLTKYPELVWLDRHHVFPPIALAVACFLIHGFTGLVWGFFLSTFLLFHTTFSINSVCHIFGSRRYATEDCSRNTWWLSIFTLGESWHNNHHHAPTSSRHGFYWWEVDLTYYTLKILSVFNIVRDLKTPSSPTQDDASVFDPLVGSDLTQSLIPVTLTRSDESAMHRDMLEECRSSATNK